jgi:hypothetical protein
MNFLLQLNRFESIQNHWENGKENLASQAKIISRPNGIAG